MASGEINITTVVIETMNLHKIVLPS